jgi:dTDP-glucose 4,6-dehydratase
VKDTVRAFLSIAGSDVSVGEVINIGGNYEISIMETAQLISVLMGIEIEPISDQERIRPTHSEVERLWADNSKAKELVGWGPEYRGLEGFRQGLLETINWFLCKENLRAYKTGIYTI